MHVTLPSKIMPSILEIEEGLWEEDFVLGGEAGLWGTDSAPPHSAARSCCDSISEKCSKGANHCKEFTFACPKRVDTACNSYCVRRDIT